MIIDNSISKTTINGILSVGKSSDSKVFIDKLSLESSDNIVSLKKESLDILTNNHSGKY